MVCRPVRRPTYSSTRARRSASFSPVWRSRRISTIMGTITPTQPERIREMVPSKSRRTTAAWRAWEAAWRVSSIKASQKAKDKSEGRKHFLMAVGAGLGLDAEIVEVGGFVEGAEADAAETERRIGVLEAGRGIVI